MFLFPATMFAHPHIFLDYALTLVFNDSGLAGVRVKWIFDEFYSASIMNDFDSNKNRKLEEDELRKIEKESFSNLKNFDYFTYLSTGSVKTGVRDVQDFSAEFNGDCVVFNFFIALEIAAADLPEEMTLALYDATYYTDMAHIKNEPVIFENAENMEASYRIVKDKSHSYYFGDIIPKVVKLRFRK